jgi:hypothetical protein
VKATASLELRAIAKAVEKTREVVWAEAPPGDITIDFDATLLDVHSPGLGTGSLDANPLMPGRTRCFDARCSSR